MDSETVERIICPSCKAEIEIGIETTLLHSVVKVKRARKIKVRPPRKGDTVYILNSANLEEETYVDKINITNVKDRRKGMEGKRRKKYILTVFTCNDSAIPPVDFVETFGGERYAKMRRSRT